MASIFASDSRLHGGSFEMLSLDFDEAPDILDPSVLDLLRKREDLRWCGWMAGLEA